MGATRADVLEMVLGDGLRQVLIGLAVGLPPSFAVTRVLEDMLVGIHPADPGTLITVALVLALAGMFGSRYRRCAPPTSIRRWLCGMSEFPTLDVCDDEES